MDELELWALKERVKSLEEQLADLKATVRRYYKESHPGLMFCDEYEALQRPTHKPEIKY
jgi:hypothetical protein